MAIFLVVVGALSAIILLTLGFLIVLIAKVNSFGDSGSID